MAASQFIPSFPPELDRRDFGNYLTGFTDGEGCFDLAYSTYKGKRSRHPVARLTIHLRADDGRILDLIQSFWGCGRRYYAEARQSHLKEQPKAGFQVSRVADLVGTVIPHFERFPLLAKKQKDFLLWREGVGIIHSCHRQKSGRGRPGTSRYSPEALAHFEETRLAMKEQRLYESPAILPPPKPPAPPSLFDGLPDR